MTNQSLFGMIAIIDRGLHQFYGKYPVKFSIGGDNFFVIAACKGGVGVYEAGFVGGEMGVEGASSVDRIGVPLEYFKVQLAVGSSLSWKTQLSNANPSIRPLCRLLRANGHSPGW